MRDLKKDLEAVRIAEKRLFENKGFFDGYALRGSLQGNIDNLSANMPNEMENILRHRELNSIASMCNVSVFSEEELKAIDQIEMDEIITSKISKLRDLPEQVEKEDDLKDIINSLSI